MDAPDDKPILTLNMTSVQYPDAFAVLERFRDEDAARHDGTRRPRAVVAMLLIKAGYAAYQERFGGVDTGRA